MRSLHEVRTLDSPVIVAMTLSISPSVLAFLNVTPETLRLAAIFVLCLIGAIAVHEFAHAFVADKLGDPTPGAQGRLTLNPLAHADPVGTVGLPIVLALVSGGVLFGWGRPVETQPRHYTRKVTMRSGMALVAAAGPISNLLLALLTLAVVAVLAVAGVITEPLQDVHPLRIFFSLNIVLFVFNLIPIHPLDGGKILQWVMGPRYASVDAFLSRYGFLILIALILTPVFAFILYPFFVWGNALLDAVV